MQLFRLVSLSSLALALALIACGPSGSSGDDDDGPPDGGPGDCSPTGDEVCDNSDNDCDGSVDEDAAASCEFPNASGVCVAGECLVDLCDAGYSNCDGDPANGCEQPLDTLDHCGSCGMSCEVDNGMGTCETGSCEVLGCDGDYSDCDGTLGNGCETDTGSSLDHCGMCGNACDFGDHTVATCNAGMCELVECEAGWENCDGDLGNGCELDVSGGAMCVCTPGTQQSCYNGPPGTEGVGICAAGTQTCNAQGTGWSVCDDQQPQPEVCGNGVDEDCTGAADDVPDLDGDGWTPCDNDCCDVTNQGCADPTKVNPGAYDFPTNNLDDDCDGVIDNPTSNDCSFGTILTVGGTELAQAMDLCQFTSANPPLPQRRWGVVSAQLVRADGTVPEPSTLQRGVLDGFGANVAPRMNGNVGVISSGTARRATDSGYVFPDDGGYEDLTNEVSAPAVYLNAHGGQLQTAPGCPTGAPTVNDSIMLRLQIRVPTNAVGFSYQFKFYSAEYPEWVCTEYNDFYLALLQTGAAGIPADTNISFDSQNNPVSVNNGFFEVCSGCPLGTAELVGTGYPETDAGATAWLTTTAPLVPGELMTLELVIWDTGDHVWDSLVLLDNFQWSLDPTDVGTTD